MNIMSGTNEEYKRKIDLLVAYNELYEENTKLKQDKQELIEWLEEKKEYCIKTKDSEFVDDLGKEQLLGSYLTCEMILERLGE